MQYLRARYYAPGRGQFTSRDPFEGWQETPYSLHPYQFGYSNPIKYSDPTGYCAEHLRARNEQSKYEQCRTIQGQMALNYRIRFTYPDENWDLERMQDLQKGFGSFLAKIGIMAYEKYFKDHSTLKVSHDFLPSEFRPEENRINISFVTENTSRKRIFTTVHELTHVLLYRIEPTKRDEGQIIVDYAFDTGWEQDPKGSWIAPRKATPYGKDTQSPEEDFCEVFASNVLSMGPPPDRGVDGSLIIKNTDAKDWVKDFIVNLREGQVGP